MIQAFQNSQAQSLERIENLRMEEMRAEMAREMERSRQEAERQSALRRGRICNKQPRSI